MFRKNELFVDRKMELEFLEKKYSEKKFQFIVLYGRRRVGKTELIKQFLKEKKGIYFLADKQGTMHNLERFKGKISEFLHEPRVELSSFDQLFSYLIKKTGGGQIIIAIDEFSYLIEKDESLPSVFQRIIDEELAGSSLFLILSGSSVSLMEQGVLSAKSPLYGRRTGQFKLNPLSYKEIEEFFPSYRLEERITTYAVFGGVPFYLVKLNKKASVEENIKNLILQKGEVLYEEVDFLLKEELRDPATYKAVLEAVASGCSKTMGIAQKAKLETKDLDRYLKVLISLGYLARIIPITERIKSKKTIYRIKDPFFRFWFTFCFSQLSELELGEKEKVWKKIELRLNAFVGKAFEEVCEQFLQKNRFFAYNKIGTWWGHCRQGNERKEIEIDLVALNEEANEILFGECKWQEKADAEKILKELKEKAKYVEWRKGNRREFYVLFAKSFKEKINEPCTFLFDLKDLEKPSPK